jgi:hypothetical protein
MIIQKVSQVLAQKVVKVIQVLVLKLPLVLL